MADERRKDLEPNGWVFDDSQAFAFEVIANMDPQCAAFMARHNALLERVTVLERALEYERTHTLDDATKYRVGKALDA